MADASSRPGYGRSLGASPSRQRNFRLTAGDEKLLSEIQTALGFNASEAVRTAIRVYAAILKRQLR
jgi:hypothetical protein